jgi:hypothetical protein
MLEKGEDKTAVAVYTKFLVFGGQEGKWMLL